MSFSSRFHLYPSAIGMGGELGGVQALQGSHTVGKRAGVVDVDRVLERVATFGQRAEEELGGSIF